MDEVKIKLAYQLNDSAMRLIFPVTDTLTETSKKERYLLDTFTCQALISLGTNGNDLETFT